MGKTVASELYYAFGRELTAHTAEVEALQQEAAALEEEAALEQELAKLCGLTPKEG